MTEQELRNRLGLFLVAAHFSILLLVMVYWLLGAFLTEEMTTTVAIIAPFLASYTTAVIRHVIAQRNETQPAGGAALTGSFVSLAFVLPALFVALLALAVILKGHNIGLRSFEDFKVMLAATETIFGVYVGQLVFSLFERPERETPAANPS